MNTFARVARSARLHHFGALIVLGVLGQLVPTTSAAQVPTQNQCTASYDPARSYCVPVEITDWLWYVHPGYSSPWHGPFASEGEATAFVEEWFGGSWCSITLSNVVHDTQPPVFDKGIDVKRYHQAHYDVYHQPPACTAYFDHVPALEQRRDVRCPAAEEPGTSYTLVYQAGNPLTPYCAMPWTKIRKQHCETQIEKGNPCEVALGVKIQRESDYVADGVFPLRFERTYVSSIARANTFSLTARDWFNPVGIGWSATYFQKIVHRSYLGHTAVTAYRPDGRSRIFRLSGSDYLPDDDISDRLIRLTDGSGNTTGWQYKTSEDETETYDADGRLLSIVNRSGIVHTLSYGSYRYPTAVTDSFGHTLAFTYDEETIPRLASVTLPGGSEIEFTYDNDDNLSTVTHADGSTRTYLYEMTGTGSNYLTGITDEVATRYATWAYSAGKVSSSEHAGGVDRHTFTYNTNGNRTVVDPLLQSRTYATSVVSGSRRVTSSTLVCQGCREWKALSHDTDGNVTGRTDFNNVETRYSSNLARNLETSRTEAFGTPNARTIATQWHSTYRHPTQIDEPGKRTTFTHDANGNILTKTELDTATSESRTWTYTYNSFGKVLTADGPRTDVSDVTTYTYYNCTNGSQCGQIETITNAAGHVTTYNTYNAHGQPLTITDPNGLVTTLAYDLRERLTSRTIGSEQTTLVYWPTGLLKKVTLPDGNFLEFTYDGAHRLTDINDSEGNRIEYTLDAMGNRTQKDVFDPSSALTQTRARVFNTLNQLWKEIGAAGTAAVTTTFVYDSNGNQTNINAPLSRNTVQAYDELNRLKQVTDPLSGVTLYGYNALDQLTSVTDPRSKVTTYTHNALGDLKQQVSPDTGTTVNTYDSGGNLATSTDARSKTGTYAYDALNRVTSLTYPDQTITYTYDTGTNQKGRLTQVTDASGSTAWTYDTHGRVLTKQQAMGSISKTVGYAYDSFGRLQTLTLPSGNTITYGHTAGKNTSVNLNGSTTIVSNVLYSPFGPTTGWTWGNSTLAGREYDLDGKITDIDSAGLKTYSYDDAFRITAITDASNSNLSQTYGYDLLDRLTSATGTGLSQGWTYDANGNRLTQSGSHPSTYTISSASNRIASITGSLTRTYGYDNAGNVTSDGTATFTYNDAGRMASATKAGNSTTYSLNALGQRVKKSTGSSSTYFVYDEAGHLVGEYDSSGNLIQETVWLGDTPVAALKPNGGTGVNAFYIHTDHLDTPRRINRPSDNVVVWRWDADPFGTTPANEDPDGDTQVFTFNLRFPGQYLDSETGLHYNYFRDYDPTVGRYTQSDPLGLIGGLNTFGYAYGDPQSFIDQFGLACGAPPEPPGPTPAVRLDSAIKRGDTDTIESLMDALDPDLQAIAKKALDRLKSKASDVIAKELRGSVNREFPGEMRDKAVKEIYRDAASGNPAARTAKKLLDDKRFKK
jgi:RHS repeat-associated protein